MSKYKLYLKDIERAIEDIESSVSDLSFKEFSNKKDCADANAMRIQIIGESLKKIPIKFWNLSKFDIKALIDFRNLISHAYFKVNSELLWDIIKNKIPVLKKEVKRVLEEIGDE